MNDDEQTEKASEALKTIQEVLKAYEMFLWHFEQVFHYDWNFTRPNLKDPNYIKPDGTFLCPNIPIEEEDNNWANRGSLLASYRSLKKRLNETCVSLLDNGLVLDKSPARCDKCGQIID